MSIAEESLIGEKLFIKYFEKYKTIKETGLHSFINAIHFEDNTLKNDLLSHIDDSTELIWYPGCGGDVSPCSIIERKKFEQEKEIPTSNKRIYLFTDPGDDSELTFSSNKALYDCSVEDYSEKYTIEKSTRISIKGKNKEDIIVGHYISLSIGNIVCKILYFQMAMEDFLVSIIKPYDLAVKWLFFLKMEGERSYFFDLFYNLNIAFPQWICANRVEEKYRMINHYAELKPMIMEDGTFYYINEDKIAGCANVMYGPMKKNPAQEYEMIEENSLISLLKDVTVLCRDDGECFDKKYYEKIDIIKDKLSGTDYFITQDGIFLLCHKKPLSEYADDTILISSHIDCKKPDETDSGINKCFSSVLSDNLLLGTYDNSITNAAVLYLMLQNKLPDNVIVAFTGDEEEYYNGATQATQFLKGKNIVFKCIVLDVTNAGWDNDEDANKDKFLFSIENIFWKEQMGKTVINIANDSPDSWIFDPLHPYINYTPDYVRGVFRFQNKVKQDESCYYYREDIECFSLCIPVHGDMHSDKGVLARIDSLENYTEILRRLANEL